MKLSSLPFLAVWIAVFPVLSVTAAPTRLWNSSVAPTTHSLLTPLVSSISPVNSTQHFTIQDIGWAQPSQYWEVWRRFGCHTPTYIGSCNMIKCPFWTFTADLQKNQEYCLYHTGAANLTTCFIFEKYIAKEDVNFLIEQIFMTDLLGFGGPGGFPGFTTWGWAQGWLTAPSRTTLDAIAFGVSFQRGEQYTLGTTLPAGSFDQSIAVSPKTPEDTGC
ncbi:hypothetical protein BGZ83_008632 [Gryganskiella cystojenkinii]|nr:hypothetical protein BGZ83_008632 [Gryganskiella cystojenkinii]